jgi:hypothetical protein
MYSLSITRTRPRAQGIRKLHVYVILGVTISLGNFGLVRSLPNGLGILIGQSSLDVERTGSPVIQEVGVKFFP